MITCITKLTCSYDYLETLVLTAELQQRGLSVFELTTEFIGSFSQLVALRLASKASIHI